MDEQVVDVEPGLYLRLFHGRTNPEQPMEDWGTDGPIFGPLQFVHTTYGDDIKIESADSRFWLELRWGVEDLIYYDAVYYGDMSVFHSDGLDFHGHTDAEEAYWSHLTPMNPALADLLAAIKKGIF
jgi:hypothetical protein